jgi:DNA-binding response OmpR family regulator
MTAALVTAGSSSMLLGKRSAAQGSSPQFGAATPRILIADDAADQRCCTALGADYAAFVARTCAEAFQRLPEIAPLVVVAELLLPDGDGLDVCRAAKAQRSLVMVTTAAIEKVPAALAAGCDAILLKPYPPNLLCARLGRLLRMAKNAAAFHRATARSVLSPTTNRTWDDIRCPRCQTAGAIAFDFAARRRMWCACLKCQDVWMERRRE